jgi:UDP-glucose 4-epimerase
MTTYFIIGGTGSLGKTLINKLLSPDNQIVVYSRDEAKQWQIKNDLKSHADFKNLSFYIGDIRNEDRLKIIIRNTKPDVVICAAALKQIDVCELTPSESILTNLQGTQNLISSLYSLGVENTVKKVCFVSTDKACAPINVYGMCKAISERLITSECTGGLETEFVCVRYGNVLESRGSIIPLFEFQAKNSKSFTLTDDRMTRFIMTLDEAVDLILRAIEWGNTGETWLPILDAMKILDLAEIYSEIYSKPIEVIGLRPGEKLHEDLLSYTESFRTKKITRSNYVILPANKSEVINQAGFKYDSSDTMTKDSLVNRLRNLKIIL